MELSSQKVGEDQLLIAAQEAKQFLLKVDELFSTYRDDSQVSLLRSNSLKIENSDQLAKEVWERCLQARKLTGGAFDPWKVEGGFDPSGFVKGWAADKCGQIFEKCGIENSLVNAAGDISVRGGLLGEGVVGPWPLQIRNPEKFDEVVKDIPINNGAVATSGVGEKGSHIKDPFTGLIAIGALSATVIGPDGGMAEALATALVVLGKDGAALFERSEFKDYSAFVIERHSNTSWEVSGS
ncbi:MAG: FAD:protein FMN transferase [Actinobacteria bacterium]|nr:FAD:protein FMN transferase [Actinomycetota bacterium]